MNKNVIASALKRSVRIGCFVVAPLFFATAAMAASNFFSEGNAKYLAGDFKAAASLYEKALDAGQTTGAVYYNLGNASLRLGRKGEAMLYYQRALRSMPRDADLRWNIRVLSDALVDRIERRSGNPLTAPLDALTGAVSPDEASLALSLSLGLLAILSLAGVVVPALHARLSFFRALAVFLALSFAALTALEWNANKDPQAVVLDRQITAHYGPSERESKAFTLHEGASGRVIDATGEWIYLSLANGTMGWVRKSGCELV